MPVAVSVVPDDNYFYEMIISLSKNYRVTIACIWLFCALDLKSQGMSQTLIRYMDVAPAYQTPPDELELLPDTSSYYVVEELYNADTLTRKGVNFSFYNYGATRYSIQSYENEYSSSNWIVQLRKINDTFSLQTTTHLDLFELSVDSTLVWWKDGLIHRASVIYNDKKQIDYTYEYENRKLVHQTVQDSKFGKQYMDYAYKDGRLIKMFFHSPDYDQKADFQYSDSLLTIVSKETKDSSVTNLKCLIRLDQMGRKLSVRTFMPLDGEPEQTLYQSENYIYHPDGGYQMTAMQHNDDQDRVSVLEFHPGYPSTERWTWKGSDQVLIKSYFRL